MKEHAVLVCGVDEAGRGPLAGPVFAAAVILDPARPIAGLADSKVLSARRREALAAEIESRAIAWGVASASVEEIDALNILAATLLAMRRAVTALALAQRGFAVAVFEAPGAASGRVDGPRQARFDQMIDRSEIGFTHAVAHALLDHVAGGINAEPRDHVARPSEAAALQRECLLSGEDAASQLRRDVPVEIALIAKQAEPIAHPPLDRDACGGLRQRRRRHGIRRRERELGRSKFARRAEQNHARARSNDG